MHTILVAFRHPIATRWRHIPSVNHAESPPDPILETVSRGVARSA